MLVIAFGKRPLLADFRHRHPVSKTPLSGDRRVGRISWLHTTRETGTVNIASQGICLIFGST